MTESRRLTVTCPGCVKWRTVSRSGISRVGSASTRLSQTSVWWSLNATLKLCRLNVQAQMALFTKYAWKLLNKVSGVLTLLTFVDYLLLGTCFDK